MNSSDENNQSFLIKRFYLKSKEKVYIRCIFLWGGWMEDILVDLIGQFHVYMKFMTPSCL